MRKTLLLLLPVAALGFAPAPVFRERPTDPEAVLKRLGGRWRNVLYEKDGQDMAGGVPYQNRIEADHWEVFTGTPLQRTENYTIVLDTKSVPMRIDWVERDGPGRSKGIFELKGEEIRYSFRPAVNGYPSSLAAPAAEDNVVILVRE